MTREADDPARSVDHRGTSLAGLRGITYAGGTVGMSLFPAFLASWQLYYFSPPADSGRVIYAGAMAISLANLIGQIVHSMADGLIGHASDKTHTRWGRRIPWVVVSAPICAFSFMALWWPPSATQSWLNIAWLVGIRAAMWVAYTGAFGPYSSLLAELTEGKQRTRIAVFMATFEVVGTILATAASGWLIDRLSGGITLGPLPLDNGFKATAVVMGTVGLVAVWLSVSLVKERPYDQTKEVPYNLIEAIKQTLRNPAFRPYALGFATFRIGLLAVLTLLPYQVNVLLQKDNAEAVAGTLQMIIVLGAVLLFPIIDRLTARLGKRIVMLWGFAGFAGVMVASGLLGLVPTQSVSTAAHLLYVFATFPVATLLVLARPILADVIDHDAELTGFRREGMYNGVEGMITKLAEGIGPVLAAGAFAVFGATRAQPYGVILLGPIAGLIAAAGWALFRRYPLP